MLRVSIHTTCHIRFFSFPHKTFDKFSVTMISLSLQGSCISHILVDCAPIINQFASFNSNHITRSYIYSIVIAFVLYLSATYQIIVYFILTMRFSTANLHHTNIISLPI